jgi:hypothetical protein
MSNSHTLLEDSRAQAGTGGDRGPILSVAAYVGLGVVTMGVYYVAVYRAFRTFVHHQGEREGVSPLMEEVQRLHNRLDDLESDR